MLIQTKCFGEVDIADEKILNFPSGILGFEELKRFTLIFDIKRNGEKSKIAWLQCVDEPELALPVMNPFDVKDDYDPMLNESLLDKLGNVNADNVVILLVVNVPSDVSKATANLKAPIVINSDNCLGAQIIAENKEYIIKYPIFKNNEKGEM